MTPPNPAAPDSLPTGPRPAQRGLMIAFFAVALGYHLTMITVGWDRPIADFNPWRQSQTALVARAFVEEGFSLAYPIPVLGPPWSIPFEFPTYQLAVAGVTRMTHGSLESSGRLVSLAAYYAALAAVVILLRRRLGLRSECFFLVGIALITPTYLSWSRAFSIESTALALGAWYLVAFDRWLTRPSPWAGVALVAVGLLAGPTKATTFAAFLAASLPLAYLSWRTPAPGVQVSLRFLLLTGVLAYLLPIGATIAWTHYTDLIKSASPLTAMLTSDGLRTWNFGTLDQRLTLGTWRQFELLASNLVVGREHILIALLGLALFPGYRAAASVLAALFIVPPLIFTNLYFAHDYYWYANGLFIVLALGLGFLPFLANPRVPLAAGLVAGGLVFYQYRNAQAGWYLPKQRTELSPALGLAAAIGREIAPTEFCVVQGFDWDPTLAYHSGRRLIMETSVHHGLKLTEEPLRSAIDAAGRERLGGLVFVGEARRDPGFVRTQLELAGLSDRPSYEDSFGTLYSHPREGSQP